MNSILITDTTREEREKIVEESTWNIGTKSRESNAEMQPKTPKMRFRHLETHSN